MVDGGLKVAGSAAAAPSLLYSCCHDLTHELVVALMGGFFMRYWYCNGLSFIISTCRLVRSNRVLLGTLMPRYLSAPFVHVRMLCGYLVVFVPLRGGSLRFSAVSLGCFALLCCQVGLMHPPLTKLAVWAAVQGLQSGAQLSVRGWGNFQACRAAAQCSSVAGQVVSRERLCPSTCSASCSVHRCVMRLTHVAVGGCKWHMAASHMSERWHIDTLRRQSAMVKLVAWWSVVAVGCWWLLPSWCFSVAEGFS